MQKKIEHRDSIKGSMEEINLEFDRIQKNY